MSSYDDLISRLKKQLESYGSAESELAKLYNEARNNRKAQYESDSNELAKMRDASVRAAGINKLKSEKDLAQIHESRGLTSSGEAIGEALNRELIEANAVANANEELSDGLKNLKSGYDSDIQKLNESEEKERRDAISKFEDKIFDLEKQKIKDENAKANNSSSGSSNNSSSNSGNSGTDDVFKPSLSESTLATRLFNMFKNSDGKLTADGKRELELYLEKLRKDNGLSDEYMKNLIFALNSYGYNSVSDTDENDGTFNSLERIANERAAKVEDSMYKFYRGRGASESEAMAEAKQHAIWAKLDYIYKNSTSRDQFIYYARKMGSSMSTIYRYFDRIENINKYNIDGGIHLKNE